MSPRPFVLPRLPQRRTFLLGAGALAAYPWRITAAAPGAAVEKLRTAHVGVGGMGAADLGSISSHAKVEVAALCDVDLKNLDKAKEKHPGAKTFRDFREMIASLGDSIDAVVVSTPDHTHAPAAMAALLAGKPVYCQKPLTHEVFEARALRTVAEKKKLASQMGVQVHSSAVYRRAVRIIQSGAIGKVGRVFAWSNKNWGFDGAKLPEAAAPPESLEWNLWLGTAADRPYAPRVYHPGAWRKLVDFGTGTLGDMGVHIFDTPYAALELTAPKSVKTECREPTGVGHPEKNQVDYEFPGTKYTTQTLRWTWLDGAAAPPSAADLAEAFTGSENAAKTAILDFKMPGQGALFIGEEGAMLLPHVAEASLFPKEKFQDYKAPEVENGNHYHEWVDACLGKNEGKTSADFGYAGPLTEALLLGVVANRFPETTLEWDAAALQVTNLPDANRLLKRSYREGFSVEGLS